MLLKKGNDVISILKEHVDIVMATLDNLNSMINSLLMLDIKKSKEYASIIDRLETGADDVHREGVVKICKGSLFGYMREDIIALMEHIDDIADSAKEASRVLMQRKIPEEILVRFLNSNTLAYVNASIDTVKHLIKLIEVLNSKDDVILEHIRHVEQSEEYADTLKNTVLQELYSSSMYDTLTIIQLKEFIQLVDRIADSAEDASDVVLIMLAKGYA